MEFDDLFEKILLLIDLILLLIIIIIGLYNVARIMILGVYNKLLIFYYLFSQLSIYLTIMTLLLNQQCQSPPKNNI